jgi:hypothetical protein
LWESSIRAWHGVATQQEAAEIALGNKTMQKQATIAVGENDLAGSQV